MINKKKALFLLILIFPGLLSFSQHTIIRRKIEKDMEKKYADPQRKKGREELDKITYENDKRYKDPNNVTMATFVYEQSEIDKKGNLKTPEVSKIVFGKNGEAMINNVGNKDETWMVFNYKDKANYFVNVKDQTAMKMPLINMQKMIERMAKKEAERSPDSQPDSWKKTDETKNINGYNCLKYIYTYPNNPHHSTYECWVSNDVKINLSQNYLLGARVSSYKFPESAVDKNLPIGQVILGILYNKKGKPVSQRELKEVTKVADETYFDMTPFKMNNVLDFL